MGRPGREENDLGPLHWKPASAGGLSQNPLATVAIDRVSQSLRRDEGDLSQVASVALQNRSSHESTVDSFSAREDLFKFSSGFDGLHARS